MDLRAAGLSCSLMHMSVERDVFCVQTAKEEISFLCEG